MGWGDGGMGEMGPGPTLHSSPGSDVEPINTERNGRVRVTRDPGISNTLLPTKSASRLRIYVRV